MAPRPPKKPRPPAEATSSTPAEDARSRLYTVLRNAVSSGDANALQQRVAQARNDGLLDPNHLRTALQSACKLGNAAIARILLEEGAPTDLKGNRGFPALHAAVTKGHIEVVRLLLATGQFPGAPADIDWRDQEGRPVWFQAAITGQLDILNLLLDRVFNIDAIDNDGRTVLHALAHDTGVASNIASGLEPPRGSLENDPQRSPSATRHRRGSQTSGGEHGGGKKLRKLRPHRRHLWNEQIVAAILAKPINVNIQDYEEQRTPLHWAAATGKVSLAEQLLSRKSGPRASVNVKSGRGKTALHLACSAKNAVPKMVDLLLRHGADGNARSDGNWTCLHNSVHEQASQEIIGMILQPLRYPDLLNAPTIKGLTPLHVAAESGSMDAVKKLISYTDIKLNAQDAFHMTPMLRAAQNGHYEVAELLAPCNRLYLRDLNKAALHSCNEYKATIVDFRPDTKVPTLPQERSIYELLYGQDSNGCPTETTDVRRVPMKQHSRPRFRWIHLPANNAAWVEALVAKAFVESGASDIEGIKSIQRCFNQQRVRSVQRPLNQNNEDLQYRSSFMKPHCHRTARGREGDPDRTQDDSSDGAFSRGLFPPRLDDGGAKSSKSGPRSTQSPAGLAMARTRDKDSDKNGSETDLRSRDRTGSVASGTNMISSKRHRRKPTGLSSNQIASQDDGALENSLATLTPTRSPSFPLDDVMSDVHGGVITLFLPYLHYELDSNRKELSAAVRKTISSPSSGRLARLRSRSFSRARPFTAVNKDELLIDGYLRTEPGLQLRRTLDQSYLRGIDTTQRDSDQVVGRYCQRNNKEEKIFMVDSLWMFIIGPSLIITAFPERWNQPQDDPLNLLDGIIQEVRIHSKTSRSVRSVHDLALLIASRSVGTFDRHVPGDEDFQFLDMFESSISHLNVEHSLVYDQFYTVSREAHEYLKTRSNKTDRISISPDEFLAIDTETELLREVRDVAEEIKMIVRVLAHQHSCLDNLSDALCDEVASLSQKRVIKSIKARIDESRRVIDTNMNDLDRMTGYALAIETNLIQLLDLKQKQANALEARFSRDQGQVVLIFTIVTIIFVPSSFLAQFMTINIQEFPRNEGNNLPLAWVLKWILGIGLGFTVFFVALAFSLRTLVAWLRTADWRGKLRKLRIQQPPGLRRRPAQTASASLPPALIVPEGAPGGALRKSMESSASQMSTVRPPHLSFDLMDPRGRARQRFLGDVESV